MYKKRIISLTVAGIILFSGCGKAVVNEHKPYDKYRDGNIYIEKEAFLKSDDYNKLDESDVLVIDQRDEKDPNMKIINSYKINDSESLDYIIDVLLKYEKENPSEWNRTHESMKYEWLIHNTAFFLNYRLNNSRDVDLNNADENYFLAKKLSYFLKNK